jgi:putative two-component system response regulator
LANVPYFLQCEKYYLWRMNNRFPQPPPSTATILIVDDEKTQRDAVRDLLKATYPRLRFASCGAQAVEFCRDKEVPNLILLDYQMPDMDGIETLKRIHAIPKCRHVPVIFLTASHDEDTESQTLEAGAVDFVVKPPKPKSILHRISTHLKFSHYQASLEDALRATENSLILSFAEIIECRDNETGGHARRTALYLKALASHLDGAGLDNESIDIMERAAPLHDIGKIGIKDRVLQKEGAFSDEEYTEMKRHPEIGAEFLRGMLDRMPHQRYLEFAHDLARFHHEKWDGTGYPDGLSGTDIPLGARILAVADVYDALTSDRVYREALPHTEAVEIIRKGRGTHFDPQVVDAFEKSLGEFEIIHSRHGSL